MASVAKFSTDIIYKNSDFIQVFPQKDFKFGPNKKHQGSKPNFLLELLLLFQSFIFEKHSEKKSSITGLGLKYGKIIFIVLYEIVAIYVRLMFVNVWGTRFKNPV